MKPLTQTIPENLADEFIGFMESHDDINLQDGAWFTSLEDAAEKFDELHNLEFYANDAVFFYLENKDI